MTADLTALRRNVNLSEMSTPSPRLLKPVDRLVVSAPRLRKALEAQAGNIAQVEYQMPAMPQSTSIQDIRRLARTPARFVLRLRTPVLV